MRRHNWHWCLSLAVLFLAFAFIAPAGAVEIKSGDMINVSGAKIKGPLFLSGNTLTLTADVDGDVFCAGQSVVINGSIAGDLICAANTVQINGPVQGDIRVAANTITLDSLVQGSVSGAGNTITLGTKGSVTRDLMLFGATVQVNGQVFGQVLGAGTQFNLNSPIGGDVRLWDVQNLNVGPNAVVKGQITYNSAKQADVASGAQIGSIVRLEPTTRPTQTPLPIPAQRGISWGAVLWSFAGGLLIWGMALWLVPRFLPSLGQTAKEAPLASLGWGILTMLLFPVGVILLMITVIGIPLAMLFIFAFIIVMIIAKVIVSDALARAMTRSVQGARWSLLAAFAAILAVVIILSKLPSAGFFVSLLVACLALGIMVMTIRRLHPSQPVMVSSGPTLPPEAPVEAAPAPPAAPTAPAE